MKTIYFDPNCPGIADSKCEERARALLHASELHTSNMLVVDYARLLRVTEKIDSLQVICNGEVIPVNEYGALPHRRLPDEMEIPFVFERIVKAAAEKKRAARLLGGESC